MFDAPGAKWLNGFSYKKPFSGTPQNNNVRIITRDNVNVSDGTLKLTARFGNDPTSTTWKGIQYSSPNSRGVLTANYDHGYYVDNVLEINEDYPTKVYFVDPVSHVGMYRNNPNNSPVPPPYADCSTETGWHNGFEGRQGDFPLRVLPEYPLENILNDSNDELSSVSESNESEIPLTSNIVYPNPTDGVFTVKLSKEWKGSTLKVIDWSGKVIYVEDNFTENREIDLSNFPNGIYILQILKEGQLDIQKIIKQ